MAANRFNAYSRLGIGVGLRAPHLEDLRAAGKPAPLDWLEILSENFTVRGGRPLRTLEEVGTSFPLVAHGVALYVGSAQGLDREHLAELRALVARVRPPWMSDHLCWGSVDGQLSHDLLPLPYTEEAVRVCVENIRRAQGELEVPFLIENVSSYAELRSSTMSEHQFLSEVAERADCGILLDVNNVYVSSVNHGFDPREYLRAIDPARVGQLHLAGHARYEGFIIDTHDQPVAEAVWQLYAETLERLGPTPTLLEWDSQLPTFAGLLEEAAKAERIWREVAERAEQEVTRAS